MSKNEPLIVDLRSDTVTTPTPQMRRAMAEAEVGDDVFGEDPTVNRLQDRVAEMLGAEAAMFVATGSMGNLISLRAMTVPGDEVICHEGAHFLHYEVGALAGVAGVSTRPLPGRGGVLDPDEVVRAIRPPMYTYPRTRVVALENTHNLEGGAVYPIDDMRAVRKITEEHGLHLYLDGARIFNASIASGVKVSEYFSQVDAISFCFSKGLGCPVGSIVAGDRDFVEKAYRFRKMHGGGWRQAGILAAACLVALDTMIDRLSEDHGNARRLGEGLAGLRSESVDLGRIETNMVQLRSEPFGFTPPGLVSAMAGRGVKFLPYKPGVVRLVTHKEVSADSVEYVLEQFAALVK